MPITKPINAEEPLSQGDILKGFPLSISDAESDVTFTKSDISLVLSRPCVIAHKNKIILATVGVWKFEDPDDIDTFDKAKTMFEQLRDGVVKRDRFYLGKIPGCGDNRYLAHLDSLHTVSASAKLEGTLPEQLQRFRVARLEPDFQRDLHRRIFESFVYLGFNDSEWYNSDDLEWITLAGKADVAKSAANELEASRKVVSRTAAGQAETNKTKNIAVEKVAFESSKRKVEEELAPLVAELEKRKPSPPSAD